MVENILYHCTRHATLALYLQHWLHPWLLQCMSPQLLFSTLMANARRNHRFEFNTVISEVMGAILKFLENPFMHFLNTLTGSLILPSNPFQHIGAAKALLAGDSMEIPLVIVYCTSLLLSAGHTKELQQYLL